MLALTQLRVAFRNLGRNRLRTWLALLAIGMAQFALLASAGFGNGYARATVEAITGPMMGHVQVHAAGFRKEHAMDQRIIGAGRVIAAIRRLPEARSVSARVLAPAMLGVGEQGHAALVVGLDVGAEREAGLLSDSAAAPGEDGVLLGAALAKRTRAKVGDTVAIVGQSLDGSIANDLFVVRGLLNTSVDRVNQAGVVMKLDRAQALFGMDAEDAVHETIVRGRDPNRARELGERVRAVPELRGADVTSWQQAAPELVSMIEMTKGFSFVVLVLVMLAAAAGVANTMLMSTYERSHELGVLMAVGTTPGRLIRLILAEAAALGLAGVFTGTLAGVAAVYGIFRNGVQLGDTSALSFGGLKYHSAIYPSLTLADVAIGVVAVVITSVSCALWPACSVARLEPSEAMRS
jgi:ABC-type lipoprotein release transport system permease subunit